MTVYRERGGHCTRCWGRFGDNMTAYMVIERVAHSVLGYGDSAIAAVHVDKWTPVCDACASPKETAHATKQSACAVCGQRVMAPPHRRESSVCSSRCYQRQRRARRRSLAKATCAGCGLGFASKRKHTRFCSDACRQRAYRERTTAGRA